MTISDRGKAFIKTAEGLRLETYPDIGGKATIGFGHLIKPGDPTKITLEQAECLLNEDIQLVEDDLSRFVWVILTQNEWDALSAFIFNVGGEAFRKSRLRFFLNSKKKDMAAAEFDKWVFATDKNGNKFKSPGLVRRRKREKMLFSFGIYGDISRWVEC